MLKLQSKLDLFYKLFISFKAKKCFEGNIYERKSCIGHMSYCLKIFMIFLILKTDEFILNQVKGKVLLPRCQFHQRFYVRNFCTNVVSADFSSYVLALANFFYKKCAKITLMKLAAGVKGGQIYLIFFMQEHLKNFNRTD